MPAPLCDRTQCGAAELTLDAGQTYTVTIEPTGTATSGYCRVLLEGEDDDKVYYTVQCASGKLTFTVYASENGKLTVTPEWGTCAIEGQKIGNGEGDLREIGAKPADSTASGTNGISNVPAVSETVPETTAPASEQPQSEPEETVPATVPAEIESASETTE